VAYGNANYPREGPRPIEITVSEYEDFSASVAITYNDDFAYSPLEGSGFYVCLGASDYEQCDTTPGSYQRVSEGKLKRKGRLTQIVFSWTRPM